MAINKTMTSKQRFEAVCEHHIPDRFPINYLASAGIDKKIKDYYGVNSERELLDELGCDFYFMSVRDVSQNEAFMRIYRGPELKMTETERVCPLGICFKRNVYDWKFGADEALTGPLRNASSPKDILNHRWPDPDWFDLEALMPECEDYSDKVIISGFWTAILGDAMRMHGFENFFANMVLNPDMIKTLINRLADFYLELNDRLFSILKGKIQIFFMGNDFGSQHGLFFSRDMWKEYYFENYKKFVDLAHSYGLKAMVHSCGAISGILDLMIEAGVDIIDPVQTTAVGMEPETLRDKFGKNIVFHGAIDTQQILPNGTPQSVRKHVIDTLDVLGKHGGYIFAPCNNLQGDIPVENIHSIYKAAKEYKPSGYKG